MSAEQNIQAAQAGYAAFGRGDMQGVIAQLDENIEWVTPEMAGLPGSGIKHGHKGVLGFSRRSMSAGNFRRLSRGSLSPAAIARGAGILSGQRVRQV